MANSISIRVSALVIGILMWAPQAPAAPPKDPPKRCAPDAVLVGPICVDKFEASVWRVPARNPGGASNGRLVGKIRRGVATEEELLEAGAVQLSAVSADEYAPCQDNGRGCTNDIFATSLPGVLPSTSITWFQANIACANSGKRLPTNAEWQMAVTGTPDPGPDNGTTDCNTFNAGPALLDKTRTGERINCASAFGAFDMVGNLEEWVADWLPRSTTCGEWPGTDDTQCIAGAATSGEPAALTRGGDLFFSTAAGPLAVMGTRRPLHTNDTIGFRCAR